MTSPLLTRIVTENLADEARAIAPHEGRHHAVEVDEAALHIWLRNFSALPALEAEDACAQLHLVHGPHQLLVRWVGGRLGSERAGTFVAATSDEIASDFLTSTHAHEKSSADLASPERTVGSDAEPAPRSRQETGPGSKLAILAGLVALLAVGCWWNLCPETPEGIIWVENATERDTILGRAAGRYTSENERLTLDLKAQLAAANEKGVPTLNTTVRVGRRGNTTVFVTAAGVVIELAASGNLRIASTDYRRLTTGG